MYIYKLLKYVFATIKANDYESESVLYAVLCRNAVFMRT